MTRRWEAAVGAAVAIIEEPLDHITETLELAKALYKEPEAAHDVLHCLNRICSILEAA